MPTVCLPSIRIHLNYLAPQGQGIMRPGQGELTHDFGNLSNLADSRETMRLDRKELTLGLGNLSCLADFMETDRGHHWLG